MPSFLPIPDHFPLRDPPDNVFEEVCQVLWGWKSCSICHNQGTCQAGNCPWNRTKFLNLYLSFYRQTTSWSTPEYWPEPWPALNSHSDLMNVVRFIKSQPNCPRRQLIDSYFAKYGSPKTPDVDKNRAFDLGMNVLALLPCTSRNQYYNRCSSTALIIWKDYQSACELLEDAIPAARPLSRQEIYLVTQKISIKRLKDRGIKIHNTNHLSQHLKHEIKDNVVYIFHHAGFLKEHLSDINGSLIPRRLALETLYTLRFVLYQWEDISSKETAKSQGLDLDCLSFDMSYYTSDTDDDNQYQYWGLRLLDLAQVLDTPEPDTAFWVWMRKRSRPEHVMIIAILAVFVAVIGVVAGPWLQRPQEERQCMVTWEKRPNGSVEG